MASSPRLRTSQLRSLAACMVLATGTLAVGVPAQAEPRRYEIDPEHFTVAFLVHHVGYAKVLGLFRQASGSYRFDEENGAMSDIRIVVMTDSLFTNNTKRDEHLRSADFFNVAEFPEMVFVASTGQEIAPRVYEIRGELTLLGVTKPLTLTANWNKSGKSPVGGIFSKPYVMGVSARGKVQRSAHGMTYAVENGWVGDEVDLIIEFEAKRQ